MAIGTSTIVTDEKGTSPTPTEKDQEAGVSNEYIDHATERAYVRKLDFYLLPFLSLVGHPLYIQEVEIGERANS